MIAYILADMRQPISYMISGVVIAIVSYPFIEWIRYVSGLKRMGDKPGISPFLAVVYIVILAKTVYYSRPSFSRNKVNMEVLGTWGTTLRAHAYVIENFMLFIPFGILLPLCLPKARKGWLCILSGCICSIFIETVQWMTKRGNCELDDIIMNTLGTVVGWGIWAICDLKIGRGRKR